MVFWPESRNPDSDGVRSACVQKFRKRDGVMAAAREIWEKVLDLLSRDRLSLQGLGPPLFSGFHMAMSIAAGTCVLATLAVFIIEPGPHVDFFPRD